MKICDLPRESREEKQIQNQNRDKKGRKTKENHGEKAEGDEDVLCRLHRIEIKSGEPKR